MHNKFLFWASIFLRFANQWFSCSFCWSQQPFVKVHCMGCSIGLECGRVSFFRQSHVRKANSEIMQIMGKRKRDWGGGRIEKWLFISLGLHSIRHVLMIYHSLPCPLTCSWSTVTIKRKITNCLLSLLDKPYMVKPALSRHPLPCGIPACVCFPKVVCFDKCVSNQKWGQRHLEITDKKKNNNNIIISGGSKPSDEGEAQSSTPWQKKGGRVRVAGSQPKNRSGVSLVSK